MSDASGNLPSGEFGPPLQGGRGRFARVLQRVGIVLLVTVGVLGVAGTATIAALIYTGERSVQRVDVDGTASSGEGENESGNGFPLDDVGLDIEEMRDIRNVLVVGSDSREGLTEEQRRAFGTGDDDGMRTDTIMLVRLDPSEQEVSVLSFPRDLLVTRCDGTTGRINGAYWIGENNEVGGASCLVQTVTDFSGIPIHHFVKVDFGGFVDIVDTVGGVTMHFEEPISDDRAHIDFPAGCVTLDGIEALGFVRARYLDDDFGRIARQQRFIYELVDEVASARTLVNVPRLFALVDAAGSAVETDQDLSLDVARRMAFSLREATADDLELRTVPSVHRTIEGAWYVDAKEDAAETVFRRFREGTLASGDPSLDGVGDVQIEDVPPVVVLNGAGIPGLAHDIREYLERKGFEVGATGDAAGYNSDAIEIVYPLGRQEEGQLLAEAFPGADLLAGPDEELTVTLGSDFDPDRVPAPPAALLPRPGEQPAEAVDDEEADDTAVPEHDYVAAQPSDVEC